MKLIALATAATLFVAGVANAVSVTPTVTNPFPGETEYSFVTLGSADFVSDTDINLGNQHVFAIKFEARGDGSLSIDTFANPFQSTGTATNSIQIFLAAPTSATVEWGTSGVMNLGAGITTITQIFASATDVKTLKFSWTGGKAGLSFSADLQAVPLPAGALLLGTALVGLGFARRRAA